MSRKDYGVNDLPPYAPLGLLHSYNLERNLYNWTPDNTRRLTAGKSRAAGGGKLPLLGLGHSLLSGTDSSTTIDANSPLRVAQRRLARLLGVPEAGGMHLAVNAGSSAGRSDLWTPTGTVDYGSAHPGAVRLSAGATYTFKTYGSTVDVYYSNLSANFSYTVDGGSAQNVTPTGADTGGKHSATGVTGDGTHTVVVTAGSNYTILHGINPERAWGVAMHSFAFGGSLASASGAAATSWTSGTTTGSLYNTLKTDTIDLLDDTVTPDMVICFLGANDIFQSESVANTIAGITTIRGWFPNSDFMVLGSWAVSDANLAQSDLLNGELYKLADTLDVPFLDLRHRYGTKAEAVAAGLTGADGIHQSHGTNILTGQAIADALGGGTQNRDTPYVRSAAYLAANPTLPDIPNDSVVWIS